MSPTDEQRQVIERPADSRTLVIAPAGSGKTYTLVHRLDRLFDEGLSSDEILMLSFSRAAVNELHNRTASGGFVSANTFDAWALGLLNKLYPGQDWHSLPFDERIREATGAIRDGHTVEHLEFVRHILLDEVQDLVGDRRRLVEALLESLDCGFTMVGDPAQAIYGFQTRGRADGPDVFTWARKRYPDDMAEVTLTRDFRARAPRPEGLVRVGAALRDPSAGGDLPALVRSEFLDVPAAGKLTDIATGLRYLDGDCAILCGDNGQALETSGILHTEGIAHRLQRRAGDTGAPRWLVGLFGEHVGNIDRDTFAERTGLTDEALDTTWEALLSVARTSSGCRLDQTDLRKALARGRLPRQVTTPARDTVTVSSMHRAKGLEWDRVYLLDRRKRDDQDPMEEARLLYMALTRCRDDVYRLDAPAATGPLYTKSIADGNRWGRYHYNRRGLRLGMALEGEDVGREQPAGTVGFAADPVEVHEYLTSKVGSGDPVILRRCAEPVGDELPVPGYTIEHDGRSVGVASPVFRQALRRYMYGRKDIDPRWSWPTTITDCWVDDIETVAGSEALGRRAGLGPHGVWLAPRLSGLSWFQYEKNDVETGNE